MYKKIRLGLCCHCLDLKYNYNVFTGRSIKLDTIKKFGISKLIEVANKNLDDLVKVLEWCVEHGIYVYRISSDIIPHASNPKLLQLDPIDKYKSYMLLTPFTEKLQNIGKIISKLDIRVTFHPGQYNQIGTPTEKVFNNTILDLHYHATFLDLLGSPKDSIIIVHGGGTYKNKELTLERWVKQYKLLPDNIKKYLVIENDETCYSANDLITLAKKINVPFLFDVFHNECYIKYHKIKQSRKELDYIIKESLKLWKTHDKRPKFHLSEQGTGCLGSHSTIIKKIPKYLLDIPKKYNIDIDIMLEAKGKEVAMAHLLKKYPKLKSKDSKEIPDKIPYKAKKDIKIDDDSILCAKIK